MNFGLTSILCIVLALNVFVDGVPYSTVSARTCESDSVSNFDIDDLQNDDLNISTNASIEEVSPIDGYEDEDEDIEKYKVVPTVSSSNDSARASLLWEGIKYLQFPVYSIASRVPDVLKVVTKNSIFASQKVSYKNYQLIRIFPKTDDDIYSLEDLRESEPDDMKFWNDPIVNRTTDVVVAPDIAEKVQETLEDEDIDFKVLSSNLQMTIKRQNPKLSGEDRADLVATQGHTMSWKRYHRYGEILRYLDNLASKYPTMVKIDTIGHSSQGLPIKVAKVSTGPKNDGEAKPAIWIDAGMHAREWIGVAVATYILSQVVERNSSYTKLLDESDWMVLPVANPDGYEYTHTHDRLWRKTRSYHGYREAKYKRSGLFHLISRYTKWFWSKCEGVDPNRNFAYQWGERDNDETSLNPCDETYAGPHAFSEPETKAIADYIMANRQNIRMYLTLHSYAQMWLSPWAYVRNSPVDYSRLTEVARKAVNTIAEVNGTHYQAGPAADLLYPISGASDSWAKVEAGIKYAYTIELPDRGEHGFLLPANQIVPIGREIWAGIQAAARLVTCGA